MLNLKINIQEDEELRRYIKDCIKGQVLSVARQEIKVVIKEVFEAKIKDSEKAGHLNADTIIKEEITKLVKTTLNVGQYSPSLIQKMTREILEAELKEAFINKYNKIIS